MKLESVPQVIDFNPYAQLTTDNAQAHTVGEVVWSSDRAFRFAVAGEALTVGRLCTEPTGNSSLTTMAVLAGAKDAYTITFTNATTTTTAGYFDSGYAIISYGTGAGQIFKIRKMAALVSGAASSVELFDPIQTALDTTSKLDIVANPYNRVLMTATATLTPVGATLCDVTAAGDYCWLQTHGVAAIIADGTIPAGTGAFNDGSNPGAIDVTTEAASVTNPSIGHAHVLAGASGYWHPVFLTID